MWAGWQCVLGNKCLIFQVIWIPIVESHVVWVWIKEKTSPGFVSLGRTSDLNEWVQWPFRVELQVVYLRMYSNDCLNITRDPFSWSALVILFSMSIDLTKELQKSNERNMERLRKAQLSPAVNSKPKQSKRPYIPPTTVGCLSLLMIITVVLPS